MKLALLERVLDNHKRGRPVCLVTLLETGAQAVVGPEGAEGDLELAPADLLAVTRAMAEDRATTLETAAGTLFVEVWNPPLKLVLVGAVHIAQALAPMASLAGYDVTIIDPRGTFAATQRFPSGVAMIDEWPDVALEALEPNKRSAIVTLTHDPKLDDPALHAALRTDAFYIGALGSRRTHEKRRRRLQEAGFDAGSIDRIRGPVGLDIGALSPAEIAISILAEMTRTLRADRVKAVEWRPG